MINKIVKSIYIQAVDLLTPCKGPLARDGYIHLKGFFGPQKHACIKTIGMDLPEERDVRILMKHSILKEIIYNKDINHIIRSYLGKFGQLDYVEGHVNRLGKSASPEWHHDSVGHRVKIFLCVNDQRSSSCTEIVPDSHMRRYFDYSNSKKALPKLARTKKLIGKIGDLLIFDTNLLHRGIYDKDPRYIVLFEYSSRLKSLLPGHIGVRNSQFTKDLIDAPLLSKNNLSLTSDGNYSYPTKIIKGFTK